MSDEKRATTTFPDRPPRVRVEWLIAAVRVALAASALLAFVLNAPHYVPPLIVGFVFGTYLVYAVAVLALVWSPIRFGRGWDLANHAFDVAIFVLVTTMTDAITAPFFASFIFIVVSASLRWRGRGTTVTVALAL